MNKAQIEKEITNSNAQAFRFEGENGILTKDEMLVRLGKMTNAISFETETLPGSTLLIKTKRR